MLKKGTETIDMKLININTGEELGEIEDVVYDPAVNQVRALLLDEGGWFSDAKVIMLEDVSDIDEDAVMVESNSVIKKAEEIEERVSGIISDDKELTFTKVITEEGDDLGYITDVYYDTVSGEVSEFEVSEGLLEDIKSGRKRITISDIVTMGEDAMVVRSFTDIKMDMQPEGGLSGAYKKAKDTAQQKMKEVRNDPRVQEKVTQAREENNSVRESLNDTWGDLKRQIKGVSKDQAAGRYATTNVLAADDSIIIARGEMVTREILDRAEAEGLLEKILVNTSEEPVTDVYTRG